MSSISEEAGVHKETRNTLMRGRGNNDGAGSKERDTCLADFASHKNRSLQELHHNQPSKN